MEGDRFALKLTEDITLLVSRDKVFQNEDELNKLLDAHKDTLNENQVKFLNELYKNG